MKSSIRRRVQTEEQINRRRIQKIKDGKVGDGTNCSRPQQHLPDKDSGSRWASGMVVETINT